MRTRWRHLGRFLGLCGSLAPLKARKSSSFSRVVRAMTNLGHAAASPPEDDEPPSPLLAFSPAALRPPRAASGGAAAPVPLLFCCCCCSCWAAEASECLRNFDEDSRGI